MKALLFLRYSLILALCTAYSFSLLAQGDFAPQVGEPGSSAIPADSNCFRDWAISCDVERGLQQINQANGLQASSGALTYAVGKADAPLTISLGDGGAATLQFSAPIYDGEGPDFAVFENGFRQGSAAFLELAFVEVSSNGQDYIRFPAFSNTDTNNQVGSFDALKAKDIHNLAGKYIAQFGTPFDLAELPDTHLLDRQNITHVRIIDVIGTINPEYANRDALGKIINDPWPTNFESGGFDLDAVGVINSRIPIGISEFPGLSTELEQNNYDILGRSTDKNQSGQVYIKGNRKVIQN